MKNISLDKQTPEVIEAKRKGAVKLIKHKVSDILRELFKDWWQNNKRNDESNEITRETIPAEMNESFKQVRTEILEKISELIELENNSNMGLGHSL